MKKQTLFATGTTLRADGDTVTLTPADKPALALATRLTYKWYDKESYAGREGYRCRFKTDISPDQMKTLTDLCMKISPGKIRGFEFNTIGGHYYDLYTDSTFEQHARDLIGQLADLYRQVSGLPDSVDDDKFQETNGQTVRIPQKNYVPPLWYHVPFDRAAWEQRHKSTANINIIDAQASAEQSKAALEKAQAEQAEQKARLLKVARIAAVAAVVLLVAILLAVILKKK